MSEDPFPRDRMARLLHRLPAYARLAWRLAREPLLSRARRVAVAAAAAYLISPVDLVPGVIPVLGQLDDIAVALAALRVALAGLSPERRRVHLDAVGLTDADLGEDVRTVAAAMAWVARSAGRAGARILGITGRAAVRGAAAAARVGGTTGLALMTRGARAARSGRLPRRPRSPGARPGEAFGGGAGDPPGP